MTHLMRWLDSRMYRKLAHQALVDAMWSNHRIRPDERNYFWNQETHRYLDRAWEYSQKANEPTAV